MSRTREFRDETALAAAARSFRRRGYAGTSIKDLELATGLSSGSLYNAFGDKENLFRAALDHYNRAELRGRIELHRVRDRPLDGLKRLFLSLLDEPRGAAYGCLLTNSAIEFGRGQAFAEDGLREGFAFLEMSFRDEIERFQAQRRGPVEGAETARSALWLLTFYQGLLVLIRLGRERRELRALIEAQFKRLAGELEPSPCGPVT